MNSCFSMACILLLQHGISKHAQCPVAGQYSRAVAQRWTVMHTIKSTHGTLKDPSKGLLEKYLLTLPSTEWSKGPYIYLCCCLSKELCSSTCSYTVGYILKITVDRESGTFDKNFPVTSDVSLFPDLWVEVSHQCKDKLLFYLYMKNYKINYYFSQLQSTPTSVLSPDFPLFSGFSSWNRFPWVGFSCLFY